ncbi:hypothetical protein [Flavobacterium lipolyticum]|uniref:Uncharacterized protein n=1 Tax=Flavobacterium lipolyticum TaxID=2893754 RepID=A0ABS8M4Q9_9FLAO|nr:hypothetical protein [Flavobacterium sp. F-126]MCC9019223.1 hypothetical protein [Flavobacterium sp. F-126]
MKIKFIFLAVLISNITFCQISINSALVPTITNAGQGDLYQTADTNQLYIGLSDGTLFLIGMGRESESERNWNLNGNSNAVATNFLGTTTDTKVTLASNNTPILELGKRGTLGLTLTKPDYNNADQYMAYLKGTGGVSALQFEVPAGTDYKPIFFTNTDGNFRMKGCAAGSDFFEIGSAGTNTGSLEFIIGDNGNEPIVFQNYFYYYGNFCEMMRIQGQGTGTTSTVRVGVSTNGVANSVLQVGGSFSLPIRAVTASTTLADNDYTVVLKSGTYSGTAVTLPAASICKGRTYVIKNISGTDITISAYLDKNGTSSTALAGNRIINLQSDGTDWLLIGDGF